MNPDLEIPVWVWSQLGHAYDGIIEDGLDKTLESLFCWCSKNNPNLSEWLGDHCSDLEETLDPWMGSNVCIWFSYYLTDEHVIVE